MAINFYVCWVRLNDAGIPIANSVRNNASYLRLKDKTNMVKCGIVLETGKQNPTAYAWKVVVS